MLLYFEFEEKRRMANVSWTSVGSNIIVHLTDSEMTDIFPEDLYFSTDPYNKVIFEIEDVANKRLLELQNILCRRLGEVNVH